MIMNFPLFCLSLIGRNGIHSSVPQSEYTANGICDVFGVSIFSFARLTSADAIKSSNYEYVHL